MSRLGGAFGVALAATVLATHGSYRSPDLFAHGYRAALWLTAGLTLVGIATATALPRREPPTRATTAPHLNQPRPQRSIPRQSGVYTGN
jgi:hypothetical protein